MNIWIFIGIVLFVLLGLLLYSSVRIEFRYLRKAEDDEIVITFYALGNLIRYQKKITQLMWKGIDEGLKFESVAKQSKKMDEEWITAEKLQKLKELSQLLIERIEKFHQIMHRFMSRIICEKLRWETWIGTGDAASTGMMIGSFWGVKTTLVAVMGSMIQWDKQPALQIYPYFNELKLEIDFHSIIRFRIGHAILALHRLVYQFIIKRRGKKWPNIQFKA